MDMTTKEKFVTLWHRYFNGAELPITFYYTDEEGRAEPMKNSPHCVIAALSRVRRGTSFSMDVEAVQCSGGKRYLGFTSRVRPDFEHFLSCGLPGALAGERYKKSPGLVLEMMNNLPQFKAPGRSIVFKRWDKLEVSDNPEVVVFFAPPDVLSGLFTLAGFDQASLNNVVAPFGSGCASIIQYPYLERVSANPRAVIGMFDVSARPAVPANVLTFAAPMSKLLTMLSNAEESFLGTDTWKKVQKRIPKTAE